MPYCAYCGSDVRDPARFNCPSCGNPHSGAPPTPVVANRGNNTAGLILGLVIGGFVVIAIIGILAAIAIPNLLTAMQRSKQKRTQADLRTIAVALEARATDTNDYPQATSLSELTPVLTPTYLKSIPTMDGWSHPIRYDCWDASNVGKCDTYAVGSGGKDGVFEHESLRAYEESETTNFDCDIVFSNGKFIRYPEGIQGR